MSVTTLQEAANYELTLGSFNDKKMVFESLALFQAYENTYLFPGWHGFIKDFTFHGETDGYGNLAYIPTNAGTANLATKVRGINADTVDGFHSFGNLNFAVDAGFSNTNIVDLLNKLYSLCSIGGSGLNWKSEVANFASLPTAANNTVNDVRHTLAENTVYKWDGTNWTNIGNFMAPLATSSISGSITPAMYNLIMDITNNSGKYVNNGFVRNVVVTKPNNDGVLIDGTGNAVNSSTIQALSTLNSGWFYDFGIKIGAGITAQTIDQSLSLAVINYDKIIFNTTFASVNTYGTDGSLTTYGNLGVVHYSKDFTIDPTTHILSLNGGLNTYLTIPAGFTKITNPLGDFNNVNYPNIQQYNDADKRLSLDTVLQKILFPAAARPTFDVPTISLTLSTTAAYVEKGTSLDVTFNSTYSTVVNAGSIQEATQVAGTTTYSINDVAISTNPQTVVFNENKTFKVKTQYLGNTNYIVATTDGKSYNATEFTGYPTDATNRWIQSTIGINAVDPIWYGCASGITDISTVTAATLISLLGTKHIQAKPGQISLPVVISGGAVNLTSYILLLSPYQISSCKYVELANTEYYTAGNGNVVKMRTLTYTRHDNTTVTLYLYYAANTYNDTTKTVTYNYTLI